MGLHDRITEHLLTVAEGLARIDNQDLVRVVEILDKARNRYAFVWLLGNGGSSSTASHFANDLMKQCGVRAVSIPDMVPIMTAYGNDEGWHKMFSRALEGFAGPNDVVIAFTCSGYSGNVVEAAKGTFESLIVFTGDNRESKIVQESGADVIVYVDHPDITVQESIHLAMCHAIVEVLKTTFPSDEIHWVGKEK